jgi:hypothetical protein
MKAKERVGLQLPSFLTSALHGVSDQLHAQHALPRGNNPRHPLNRRVGGPLCWTGCSGEEKTLLFPPVDEPRSLGFPVCGVVAILTKSIG